MTGKKVLQHLFPRAIPVASPPAAIPFLSHELL